MEDRVKMQLDKEHSKRFQAMCHRNSTISKEHKVLQSFYDNERKKSMHKLDNETSELQKALGTLSLEKWINERMTELTSLAFTDRDSPDTVQVVSPEEVKASEETLDDNRDCRYLRVGTNPFHPSEMSFDDHILESHSSLSTLHEEDNRELSSDCGVQSTTSKVPEDEMKDVVNKLVKHYNIDKLKDLTRVLMLNLHKTKDRVHYEDQLNLISKLSKYFNESESDKKAKLQSECETPSPVVPTNNNTFLFLKSDRQAAIKEEVATKAKLPPLKEHKHSERSLLSTSHSSQHHINRQRRLSMPVLKPMEIESALLPNKERRSSAPVTALDLKHKPQDIDTFTERVKESRSDVSIDTEMRIYLKLGHGALLKLPTFNSDEVKRKQRSWTRKGLHQESTKIEDLRIVMRHCRYLRFPKDLIIHD